MMTIARELKRSVFTIQIVVLMLICPIFVSSGVENASVHDEAPFFQMPISNNVQNDILILCDENRLSGNLVLAIFYIEGIHPETTAEIKTEIAKLVYLRDYWALQGIPDEVVFDLMLLSRQRGIEGCISYMESTNAYDLEDYVKKVTEYKYYLDQRFEVQVKEI